MNRRTQMGNLASHIEWRVEAITESDNADFACKLQSVFSELAREGFVIVGQMTRGNGLIVTAQRMQATTARPEVIGGPSRLTPVNAAVTSLGAVSEEVLYHYWEGADCDAGGTRWQQAHYPDMPTALRVLRQDLASTSARTPVSLTTVVSTRFDPERFKQLFELFSEELREEPRTVFKE